MQVQRFTTFPKVLRKFGEPQKKIILRFAGKPIPSARQENKYRAFLVDMGSFYLIDPSRQVLLQEKPDMRFYFKGGK